MRIINTSARRLYERITLTHNAKKAGNIELWLELDTELTNAWITAKYKANAALIQQRYNAAIKELQP